MNEQKFSIAIIGSGISGLYAALKLQQYNNPKDGIVVISKSSLKDSNSFYAQGGMVAVLDNNKEDSIEQHVSDTIKAGAGLSEFNTVKFISENSNKIVNDLLSFGVDFDRDEQGNFKLTKEAAHSIKRILHCKGDATGREMELALINAVKNNPSIKIIEHNSVIELLETKGICNGMVLFNRKTKEHHVIYTKAVILATGGLGQIYKYTTNPVEATGDGISLAYRIGADLQDMEFVQFHPTALAIDDEKHHNRFLISEAVRGEGAKLCDKFGNLFMSKYHEKKELAPRDIVARAIFNELENGDVFLDTGSIPAEKFIKRFPTISKKCIENGIDISKVYIPVAPAAHYFMGGVKTNLNGQTSIKGLYAIGEVSSTGLHGANRLASNSLLECVVCAYETAKNIELISDYNTNFDLSDYETEVLPLNIDTVAYTNKIKQIMWDNVGIYRSESLLKKAIDGILKLEKNFVQKRKYFSFEEYELKSMFDVSKLIITSALLRKESRGAHFRIDYPETSEKAEHRILNIKKGDLKFVK